MIDNFKGIFCLSHKIRVYIPSTVDVDKKADTGAIVDDTRAKMAEWFGGSTTTDAVGAWLSEARGVVCERVVIVESFGTAEQMAEFIPSVLELAGKIKNELKQEAVSVEYDNKLYFI